MVITATSLCATCDSSCASTPSSSAGSSRRSSPVVTHTTALSGFRPVANALGMSIVDTAITGLGMSAMAHSRSTTACSSGYSSRPTTFPRIANIAILSENQNCATNITAIRATTSSHDFSNTINAAKKATYSSPSRNMVTVIRTVKRRSLRKRLRICTTPQSGTRPNVQCAPGPAHEAVAISPGAGKGSDLETGLPLELLQPVRVEQTRPVQQLTHLRRPARHLRRRMPAQHGLPGPLPQLVVPIVDQRDGGPQPYEPAVRVEQPERGDPGLPGPLHPQPLQQPPVVQHPRGRPQRQGRLPPPTGRGIVEQRPQPPYVQHVQRPQPAHGARPDHRIRIRGERPQHLGVTP